MIIVLAVAEDRFGKQYWYRIKDTDTGQIHVVAAENYDIMRKLRFSNAQYICSTFPHLEYKEDVKRIRIKKICLYHGSDKTVRVPLKNFKGARENNDYGKGFYTAEYIRMADEWAVSRSDHGIRNEYTIDLTGLRILDLDTKGTLAWIAEVLSHRGTDSVPHEAVAEFCRRYKVNTAGYDIIAGYRADDAYAYVIDAFINNIINTDEVVLLFKNAELGKQIFLKSEKAFTRISFTQAVPVDPAIIPAARFNAAFAKQEAVKYLSAQHGLVITGAKQVKGITFRSAITHKLEWSDKNGQYYMV